MGPGVGDPKDTRSARDAVAERHGRWAAANIHLGDGVYTLDHGHVGTLEFMVHSVTQSVADLASKPLSDLRVLDLACGEGAYAIELGLHGATVVGVEGRPSNGAKARFAAQELGLENVQIIDGDVREISEEKLGRFDVVLCLGILYHLEAEAAVRLLGQCYALCDQFVVIRTAIGLAPDFHERIGPHSYRGRRAPEDVQQGHAALDTPTAILPTKSSLLNVLSDVGFSSVVELRNPSVPGLDDFIDTTTLIAARGQALPYRSIPALDILLPELRRRERRGPSWVWRVAAPQQGPYWRLRERVFHTVRRTLWQSHHPIESWRVRR